MKQKPISKRRRNSTKFILRLPDLEHAKAAVWAMLCKVRKRVGGGRRVSKQIRDLDEAGTQEPSNRARNDLHASGT